MIVVTVARRPLSGSVASNVLGDGTGALNIDATRIAASSNDMEQMLHMSQGFVGRKFGRPEIMNYGYEDSMAIKTLSIPAKGGRWPANLVLGHLDGCRKVGTTVVGSGERRAAKESTAQPFATDRGWNGHSMTRGGASAPESYGAEEVGVWECVGGCPVAELNAQSGTSRAGGRVTGKEPSDAAGAQATYGKMARVAGPDPYEDKGGASRYFKQVGGQG